MEDATEIDHILTNGAARARQLASPILQKT